MKTGKNLLFLLVFVSFSASVMAGGWLQGKSKGYFKLSQSALVSDQFYNGNGDQVAITTLGVYHTSLYGEYGLSNKFDVIANVPISRLTLNDIRRASGSFTEGDEFTSLGDIDVGIKYGIRQGKSFVLSASLTLGIPSGDTEGGRTKLLQTGDGEFNQLVKLEAGYGFSSPLYISASLGFNNRTNNFSEEFRYEAELGYTFQKRLLVALKLSGIESFENGDAGGASTGVFSNNIEFLSFGPEVNYTLKDDTWGISGSYRTANSGQFILASPSYEFGVFLNLK